MGRRISEPPFSCPRGCTHQFYTMTGQDIDDDVITWDGTSYNVTTDDQFMMQVGEGCCGFTTSDNAGYVCAEIYFLYSLVVWCYLNIYLTMLCDLDFF